MMIELAKTTNCRTHIVHLSAADALEDLAAAQRAGVPITAETCPHYLVFDAEHIQQGATHFKCAPPIREARNRERLWTAVKSGLIEFIVSDHSPCTPNLKLMETGDFSKAWGGIAGLQFSLSTVWSEMHRRGFNIADLSRLMSYNTSKFLGLNSRKGQIQAGHDADFVVWDPNAIYTLTQDQIYHRHKVTPYLGQKLRGRVHHTFVGGKEVFNNDKSTDKFLDHPQGTEVLRKV